MPGGFADFGRFPAGLKEFTFLQAHQDRVKSARFQSGAPADVVSVVPGFRIFEKDLEHLNGLGRQPHPETLHI